ncbi:MAG: HAMP domain-containing sensor histidine kinase, partial [Nitrospirota bacterium]
EDLLTYARQDELRLEEFDLPVLINEVMSSISLPEDIRVTVNLPKTRFMISDRDKVRQIILNLIQNSLDAMDKGGSLTITAEDKKNSTGLSVSDTGIGIDSDSTDKVFKPFYTTKAKGTGLGLAIVWRYISALGGKISVESEKDKGTTFRILIPKKIKKVA